LLSERRLHERHVQRRVLLLERDVQWRMHWVRREHWRVRHDHERARSGHVHGNQLLQRFWGVRRPEQSRHGVHVERSVLDRRLQRRVLLRERDVQWRVHRVRGRLGDMPVDHERTGPRYLRVAELLQQRGRMRGSSGRGQYVQHQRRVPFGRLR
jgi:hypothetical protein